MRTRLSLPMVGLLSGVLLALVPVGATTLLELSLDEMIQQSTGIVRATVTGSRTAYVGADIYTYYQLQVAEDLRSANLTSTGSSTGAAGGGVVPAVPQMEVAVPGGAAKGVRQTVAGAPSLQAGQQYVVFLWTSRSGLTQVIGLSQGLFQVQTDAAGNLVLTRPSTAETVVNQGGQAVPSQTLSLPLSALRTRVAKTLEAAQ